jgi:hypothetical protein
MHGQASTTPHAHQLIGWERRVGWQLICLAALCFCALPLIVAELGLELRPPLDRFHPWLMSRAARETTGLVAGGIVLFQLSLGVGRQLASGRAVLFHWWRAAHQVLPIALVFVLLLHTRGRAGVNLNRWLITVFLLQVFLVQAGHLMKAFVAAYGTHRLLAKLDRSANDRDGFMHRLGLQLHVLLAITVAVLLSFHVFAVYYF